MADPAKGSVQSRVVALAAHTWFSFLIVIVAEVLIALAAFVHVGVDPSISKDAIDALGGLATVLGVSYVGGSVVTGSSLMTLITSRFGRSDVAAAAPVPSAVDGLVPDAPSSDAADGSLTPHKP